MLGELESNRAAVEATIDQEMGGLRQLLNDRIDTRTAELQAALAQEHGQRRTALETQRADVAQQLGIRDRTRQLFANDGDEL